MLMSSVAGLVLAVTGVITGIFALLSDELNENRRLKYVLVGVLVVFSVYAMLGSLMSLANTNEPMSDSLQSSIPFAVDATKDWQSAGIQVRRGETVRISVVGGKWTIGREKISDSDILGLPERYQGPEIWAYWGLENAGTGGTSECHDFGVPNCPVPTAKVGTLVAKVGVNGQPFAIGNQKIIVVQQDGTLFLRVNDGENEGATGLSDNAGVLAVEIETLK